MNMKNYLFGIIALLLLAACQEAKFPAPAISFKNTATELADKEQNKWLSMTDNVASNPNSMGYIYDLRTITYLTPDNDTLKYNFSHDKLLCVLISLQTVNYEAALNNFKQDKNFKDMGNTFFEDQNKVIVRVGKEANNHASLLYLNNENEEISNTINLLKGATNGYGKSFFDYDNDHLYPQILLGLMGMADVANAFGNYEVQQHYYVKALTRH